MLISTDTVQNLLFHAFGLLDHIMARLWLFLMLLFVTMLVVWVVRTRKHKPQRTTNQLSTSALQQIDSFLSDDECDVLIAMAKQRLVPSRIYEKDADVVDTHARISDQCWCRDDEHPLVQEISKRIARWVGMPMENMESLQIVRYGVGGFFQPHYDPCLGDEDECRRMERGAGKRHATVLIYLNDVEQGGETCFPLLNQCIVPRRGRAVLFYSTDEMGHLIETSKHTARPVERGVKWVCNKWVHPHRYQSS